MTELSFLLDLLLNDETPLPIKKILKDRIKEVESNLSGNSAKVPFIPLVRSPLPNPTGVPQSASTLAALARQASEEPQESTPAEVVAHTAAAAIAMQDRQAAISAQVSGKPEKGRTSPRKF